MPFYLRKSFGRGPFRLNLSKSGLGASFGVKGLRVGVGPRGTYVAGGRGGLYYRQYLNGGRPGPSPVVSAPDYSPVPATMAENGQSLEFAATPANDDEVAAEINARLRATKWSKLLIVAAVVSGLFVFAKGFAIVAILACIGFIVFAVVQSKHEAEERKIEFNYELDAEANKLYGTCVKAFEAAAACSSIWRVTTQTLSRDRKYTAGAGSTVDRALTRITFNDPRLTSNEPTIWIWATGGWLCLLPDRLLFFGPMGVSSLDYPQIRVTASNVDFRESGPVPADSTNVGTTWQYVNKSGGPDRRFNNNRQLPIQRYSELSFQHPKLSFQLEFSKMGAGQMLAKTFEGMTAVSVRAAHPEALPEPSN